MITLSPTCTQLSDSFFTTITFLDNSPFIELLLAPIANSEPSELKLKEFPKSLPSLSPLILSPNCNQLLWSLLNLYTCVCPVFLPFILFIIEPNAIIVPSSFKLIFSIKLLSISIFMPCPTWVHKSVSYLNKKTFFVSL